MVFVTIQEAVEDYLLHLRELNRGARTAVEYRRYLGRLLDELRGLGLQPSTELNKLDRGHLRAFSRSLLRDGLADRTRATILSCVRSWLRYLTKEGHPVPPPDVVEVPKNPRTVPELDERLPETVKLPPPPRPSDVAEILTLRDRALLLTLYSTQLRVSELCHLNRDQLDYERGLAVVVGKGRKTRTVFFGPEVLEAIDRYLDARADQYRPLFIRHDHNAPKPDPATDPRGESLRLAVDTAEYVVRRTASARGIAATPHSYRHYGATAMIRAGMDLRSVQEALGHASVTTTQIYTHVNPKRLHDDWRRFHPAAQSEPGQG